MAIKMEVIDDEIVGFAQSTYLPAFSLLHPDKEKRLESCKHMMRQGLINALGRYLAAHEGEELYVYVSKMYAEPYIAANRHEGDPLNANREYMVMGTVNLRMDAWVGPLHRFISPMPGYADDKMVKLAMERARADYQARKQFYNETMEYLEASDADLGKAGVQPW